MVTVQPVRKFTGIVSLKTTASAAGIAVSLHDIPTNGIQDTVLLGNTATLRLAIVATITGNFTANVIAYSGSIFRSIPLPVFVQNVTMSATPKAQDIARGSSSAAKIDLTSVNRLGGNLSLGASIFNSSRYLDPNSHASIPMSVILPQSGTVEVVMTIQVAQSAQTGPRTVEVEASRATWIFVLTFTFNVV